MRFNVKTLFPLVVLFSVICVFLFFPNDSKVKTVDFHRTPIVQLPDLTCAQNFTPDNTPPVEDLIYDSDDNMPVFRRMQLALAKICVSEAGFQTRTNDCMLIYQALKTRSSTGEITMGIMRAYSGQTFDRSSTRTDSRRWIPFLNHEFSKPHGWSETIVVPWSARSRAFEQVYEYAGNLIRTRPENPCGARIDHWGSKSYQRQRLLHDGWTIVECGETLNAFWTMPIPARNVVNSEANTDIIERISDEHASDTDLPVVNDTDASEETIDVSTQI